jgi:hypothetical protein
MLMVVYYGMYCNIDILTELIEAETTTEEFFKK